MFFYFKFIFSTVIFTYLLSDAQQNTSPEMNSGKKHNQNKKSIRVCEDESTEKIPGLGAIL